LGFGGQWASAARKHDEALAQPETAIEYTATSGFDCEQFWNFGSPALAGMTPVMLSPAG